MPTSFAQQVAEVSPLELCSRSLVNSHFNMICPGPHSNCEQKQHCVQDADSDKPRVRNAFIGKPKNTSEMPPFLKGHMYCVWVCHCGGGVSVSRTGERTPLPPEPVPLLPTLWL